MADIRAGDWGTVEHWTDSIRSYLAGERDPREAKKPRVAYVAVHDDLIVGLVAGHLTRRFQCDGDCWRSGSPNKTPLVCVSTSCRPTKQPGASTVETEPWI
jgi:hypothetical protein